LNLQLKEKQLSRYQHQFEVVGEVLLEEVDIDLDRTRVIVEIEVILQIVVDHVHDIRGPDHEQDHDRTHIQTLTVMITQMIDVLIDPDPLDLIVLDDLTDLEGLQLIQENQLVDHDQT